MRVFVILMALVVMAYSSSALAQKAYDTCKKAKHTGDMISCLDKQYDAAADALNDVFADVQKMQAPEHLDLFRQAQTNWLSYRDQACAWEKMRAENESLARVEELICMLKLTEQRQYTLSQFTEVRDEKKEQEAYLSAPRWVNVVLADYPEIYWRHAAQVSVDLDCDSENEEVLLGKAFDQEEGAPMVKSTIVVSTNPPTGKPQNTLLYFEHLNDVGETCQTDAELIFAADKTLIEEEQKQCKHRLEIRAKGCNSRYLSWDGQAFVLDSLDAVNEASKTDNQL